MHVLLWVSVSYPCVSRPLGKAAGCIRCRHRKEHDSERAARCVIYICTYVNIHVWYTQLLWAACLHAVWCCELPVCCCELLCAAVCCSHHCRRAAVITVVVLWSSLSSCCSNHCRRAAVITVSFLPAPSQPTNAFPDEREPIHVLMWVSIHIPACWKAARHSKERKRGVALGWATRMRVLGVFGAGRAAGHWSLGTGKSRRATERLDVW